MIQYHFKNSIVTCDKKEEGISLFSKKECDFTLRYLNIAFASENKRKYEHDIKPNSFVDWYKD